MSSQHSHTKRRYSVDIESYRLAQHFLSDEPAGKYSTEELAQDIQDAVEAFFEAHRPDETDLVDLGSVSKDTK